MTQAVIKTNSKVVPSTTFQKLTILELNLEIGVEKRGLFDQAIRTIYGDSLYVTERPDPNDIEIKDLMFDKDKENYNIPEENPVDATGKACL